MKGVLLSLCYFLGLHVDLQLSHKVGREIKLKGEKNVERARMRENLNIQCLVAVLAAVIRLLPCLCR